MDKPIPAFYACYLLRSTIRHSSLYIGSTPNPLRRLKQHNGESKGGAVRTSRTSLRPWEMTCLVTGFPSKIAALQFEWAWQNTHLTRHVPADSRLAQARSVTRISPKTGRVCKRPARPRLCLSDRLANLHLLLQASSFERWPLKVTFYSEDVYRVWMKWTSQRIEQLRPGIGVTLDDSINTAVPSLAIKPESDFQVPKGISALDVGYSALKPHLEKSRKLIEDASWLHCSICRTGVPSSGAMTLTCPQNGCDLLAHIECLSERFLHFEKNPGAIIPTSGLCPSCGTKLQWVDLVKELSLRMHGEKEISTLFKTKRCRSVKGRPAVQDGKSEGSAGELGIKDDAPMMSDAENDWHELSDSSIEGNRMPNVRNVPTMFAESSSLCIANATTPRSEPFVEDSEWEEAQVLT